MPIEAGLVNRPSRTRRPRSRATTSTFASMCCATTKSSTSSNRIYDQRRWIFTEPSLRLTVEDMIARSKWATW